MNQERILKVLVAPHISEKASMVGDRGNQFVFKVLPDATKPEVKKAVEQLFKVDVESVQMVNLKGKTKRFRQAQGQRNGIKKAYVRLKKGQDINFTGEVGG